MNILCTINKAYIHALITMLKSLINENPNEKIIVYIMNSELDSNDYKKLKEKIKGNIKFIDIKVDKSDFKKAPVSKRFPVEMYYRLFAYKYLPKHMDRVLYLDPDIIIINSLKKLYNSNFEDKLILACTHIKGLIKIYNNLRLNIDKKSPYINSGVLLINLKLMREEVSEEYIFDFIHKNKYRLHLPDQDVISALYQGKIKTIDTKIYNLSEKIRKKHRLKLEWIKENTVIIHYCGRNKPWKENYKGKLNIFYEKYEEI